SLTPRGLPSGRFRRRTGGTAQRVTGHRFFPLAENVTLAEAVETAVAFCNLRRNDIDQTDADPQREPTMPNYTSILFEVRDAVAQIALNRQQAANSLNSVLSAELMDAFLRCEEESAIRAVIITGTGRFFCAGADLKGFYSQASELKSRVSLF